MICLDTNYLIKGIELNSAEAIRMLTWHEVGEKMVVPMPAWFEFLCGPLKSDQVAVVRAFISKIIPFDEAEARMAARLFNSIQRKRSHRVDAMIAGTAIAARAKLATNNRADFEPFVSYGLELV
ncbi:MAG: type II toxin-antitoxin system VapC family toxin [Chthoniobacterales bacterium]|nr:type II toxin-antitoxin system VapC family toxin [Chthoniobacterales bacterium]